MRHADYDTITPQPDFAALPATFRTQTSNVASTIKLLLVGPLAIALAIPFVLVGREAAAASDVVDAVLAHPLTSAQLATALALWVVLFALPLGRAIARMMRERVVTIDAAHVSIETRGLLGRRQETLPLASYRGVAHRVRTTLSGARHELVLVHPDADRSVLLAVADRIGEATVTRTAALLGLPEVSAQELAVRLPRLPAFGQPAAGLATG